MADFVHLHLHTEYSLLDGACRISDIPAAVKDAGHTAVAMTDHGAMYGAVAFFKACRDAGIKPIIGCEVYVAPRTRFDRNPGQENTAKHLVLLCENEVGYKNLIKMVSLAYTEGFYSRPRVDDELLMRFHEGLIALSACLAGDIPSRLTAGDYDGAEKTAEKYKRIFGENNFYIELQNHGIADQRRILPSLYSIAKKVGVGVVATNDVHYLRREDARAQAVLMCIQTNTTVDEGRPIGFETDEFYYKSTAEMRALFGSFDGALENTVKIAERCNFEFSFGKTLLPAFRTANGLTADEALRRLAFSGFEKITASGKIPADGHDLDEYRERLEYELSVIKSMGYSDYFLIVSDYVGYAKSHGIPVGPGRGSGVGSITAYFTGITDIDSIRYELYFERFLNPERVSMPDIDIDFCYERRDEVLKYVKERYGDDHVTQIITFGTMAARAVIRDVGRALGIPYADVDAVARLIPREPGTTLRNALEDDELREKYEGSDKIREMITTALVLEGMPRNVSVHAAGVVITEEPLTEYLPLSVSNGAVITQYDMDTVAALGLLKFDFLALRYLTIIEDAVKQIKEKKADFDLDAIDLSDKKTYDLISAGQTLGVFQLESPGMRAMLGGLKPKKIDDILAAIALFRPGPMESIPKYIAGKNDPAEVKYPSELLKPVLEETHGCIVYQEQVMSIFRIMADYSLGRADVVRRAMAKKKASALEAEREKFVSGCIGHGMSEENAEKLFDDMANFANYAFNKSHAAAYAVIAYNTAYLKAHYPREYLSALLTSVLGDQSKAAVYIAEAGKLGIRVLPPDINRSFTAFHVSGKDITFGLLALKNVGRQFVASILAERSSATFASFEDFLSRMSSHELNRRMVETLIKVGAFDSLGVYRSKLLDALPAALASLADKSRNNLEGQLDMFSTAPDRQSASPSLPGKGLCVYADIPEFATRELLALEKECAGMYFSGHILDGYSKHIEALSAVPLGEFSNEAQDAESENDQLGYTDRQQVTVSGLVSGLNKKMTRKDEIMAFFNLEDRFGNVEVVVFPKKYEKYGDLLQTVEAIYIIGTLSVRESTREPGKNEVKILLNMAGPLISNDLYVKPEKMPKEEKKETVGKAAVRNDEKPVAKRPSVLYIRVSSKNSLEYRKCENLVGIFEGALKTVFYYADTKSYETVGLGSDPDSVLIRELINEVGKENVVLK